MKALVLASCMLFSTASFAAGDTMLVNKYPFVNADLESPISTLKYLSSSVDNQKISLNDLQYSYTEHQRLHDWLVEKRPEKFVVVGVNSYRLYVFENKGDIPDPINYQMSWYTKVVVGSRRHQTPLRNFNITSFKYNPTWTPTRNMIKRNIGSTYYADNKWVSSHHLDIYHNGKKLSPYQANGMSTRQLRFVQPSGYSNALGSIKFETTSDKNIYLHDTNQKYLFNNSSRAYSSGCVRVENPTMFAQMISGISESKVKANIGTKRMFWDKIVDVPVFFMYDTVNYALGDDHDKLTKLPDIYNKF